MLLLYKGLPFLVTRIYAAYYKIFCILDASDEGILSRNALGYF